MSDPTIPPASPTPNPVPPPTPFQPPVDAIATESDPNSRNLAMIAYILGITVWIGPLIFYLLKKDDPTTSPFVKQESKKVLNWGLTIMIGIVIGIVTTPLFCIGAILNFAIFITNIVFVIINAMKASKGQAGSYPFSIQFIK